MATYQQAPAYQTYQSLPYQIPVNEIVQSISTRNQYWDIGASRLKNSYETYLNLDLTHNVNKNNLNTLMEGVNKNLKKVVQSDLSIASNVGEAMKIFDPIVSGKTEVSQNILGDNSLSRHYRNQLQIAESYRTQNGGKEYSDVNVSFLNQGLDKFSKDDPSKWKEHYAIRRSYSPYYDVQSEIRDLMKNFKPNIYSTTTPDIDPKTGKYKSFYLISKTDKSSYEKQLRAYLGANLSDKAKRQLSINGSVNYYSNPTLLAEDYTSYIRENRRGLESQIKELKGTIAGSSNQNIIDASNNQISSLQVTLDDLTNEEAKIRSGDSDYFKQNIDRISGSIYTNKYINNLARANERIDLDISYKPDQAALRWFSEDQENRRFNTRLQFDARENALDRESRLEQLRLSFRLKKGEDQPFFLPFTGTASEEESQKRFDIDFLNKQLKSASDLKEQASKRLQQEIESLTGKDLGSMDKTERDKLTEQWLSENKGRNPVVDDYFKKYNTANNIEMVYKDLNNYAEIEAKRLFPELYEKAYSQNVPTDVTVYDISGNEIKFKFSAQDVSSGKVKLHTTGDFGVREGSRGNKRYYVDYNGKTHELSEANYAKLESSSFTTRSKISDFLNEKNKILSKSVTAIREEKMPVGDQEKIKAYSYLRDDVRRFGVKDQSVKDIRIFSIDREGANFSVPPGLDSDDLGITKDKLELNVKAMGGRLRTVDGIPVYHIPWDRLTWRPNIYNDPELNPLKDYFNYKKAIALDEGEVNTTIDSPPTVVYDPNNTGENIKIRMDLNAGVPEFFIQYKKKKMYDLSTGRGFSSVDQAAAYIKQYIRSKQDLEERIINY